MERVPTAKRQGEGKIKKSEIFLYNKDPNRSSEMKELQFSTYAWSFKFDSVIEEATQLTIRLAKEP